MLNVIKATREIEPFSEEKVINSIKRAGIPEDLQMQVLEHVKEKLYENIPTSEIYKHIIEFLRASSKPYSQAKYSLKQAIMELGPTGYPFENFVAEILKAEGYKTSVRQFLNGNCITHEIDVIALKNDKKIMVECKFHNNPGARSDIHVSLYTKARFDDVKEKNNLTQAWLVTNTKITVDGISYGICNDMKIIGWSYPEKGSLRELIEKLRLHPITALTSLSKYQKEQFLSQNIVLVKTLCENPSLLETLGIPAEKRKEVEDESNFICGSS